MMIGLGINHYFEFCNRYYLIVKWRRMKVGAHYLPNFEPRATSSQGFLSYKERISLFDSVRLKVFF